MKLKTSIMVIFQAMLILFSSFVYAENIDPYDDDSQYAYGENVGWLNFEPNAPDPKTGATVSKYSLTGYVWAANIGWISLSCSNTDSCGMVDYGVVNDGNGVLSGYAWSANAGWISFSCESTASCASVDYGVTIDGDGVFDGWAYGQNFGWIHLSSASPVTYQVKACVVNFDDLANFVNDWLLTGPDLMGDLSEDEDVDFEDYADFSLWWRDYCPNGWVLK